MTDRIYTNRHILEIQNELSALMQAYLASAVPSTGNTVTLKFLSDILAGYQLDVCMGMLEMIPSPVVTETTL